MTNMWIGTQRKKRKERIDRIDEEYLYTSKLSHKGKRVGEANQVIHVEKYNSFLHAHSLWESQSTT